MFKEQRFTTRRTPCTLFSCTPAVSPDVPAEQKVSSSRKRRTVTKQGPVQLVSRFFSIEVQETLRPLITIIAQAERQMLRRGPGTVLTLNSFPDIYSQVVHKILSCERSGAVQNSIPKDQTSVGQGVVKTVSCPNVIFSKDQASAGHGAAETVSCPNVIFSKDRVSTRQVDVHTGPYQSVGFKRTSKERTTMFLFRRLMVMSGLVLCATASAESGNCRNSPGCEKKGVICKAKLGTCKLRGFAGTCIHGTMG